MNGSVYPVRVHASLDARLNRWLWLVKWLLVLPHFVVLAFLWVAFVVLSVVSFFAILFTGSYPRTIFDFNVGVLRWTWRASYYAYGALGTDRYPPFTLAEVPDYPAHLEVEYPQHLSRGLVLVKWWLLAIPHYLVVAFFAGGGFYLATEAASHDLPWMGGGGLIGLLVLIAAVILLFTGNYPRSIFDLVLGMNRWVLRVAAYAALMTDDYPPFRLDMGPDEPGHLAVAQSQAYPPPDAPSDVVSAVPTASVATDQAAATRPWTPGRVVVVVLGSLLLVAALALAAAGTAVVAADKGLRDDQGFFMSRTETLSSPGYAVISNAVELQSEGAAASVPNQLIGDAKVTATPPSGETIFVGIARSSDVDSYLADVEHSVLVDFRSNNGGGVPRYRQDAGGAPRSAPGREDIWVASASGTGQQSAVWPVESGAWTAVVMHADGSRPVTADVSAGATFPGIGWAAAILFILAGILLTASIALLFAALRSRSVPPARPGDSSSSLLSG
ncbi:MAG: DUF4389 domain-containing protein [Propionibacteriales bacterium]|nr:DUF4389 domain-containing protein [Propionibacteriales bacterium]